MGADVFRKTTSSPHAPRHRYVVTAPRPATANPFGGDGVFAPTYKVMQERVPPPLLDPTFFAPRRPNSSDLRLGYRRPILQHATKVAQTRVLIINGSPSHRGGLDSRISV